VTEITDDVSTTPDNAPDTDSAPSLRRRALSWARDLAIFAILLAGVFWYQTRSLVDTGGPAPAWDLPTLDGQNLSLESLRGKPTVLFFWAPWCGVCKADAHNIADVREAVGDDANVVPVALSFQSIRDVRAFADENHLTDPIVLGDRAMAEAYAIDSFPTVYILDSEGNVASHAVGYTTELGVRVRLMFAR
jgi:peroxiredoxin